MIEEKYGIKVEPFAIAEAILVEDLYEIVKIINKVRKMIYEF